LKTVLYEICILAGGLSRRMGRDKSRLRLGSRTMLAQIRSQARATGLPVRVIRRDAVPRCGPLGGTYTALSTTHAGAVLFLACDMPFVTSQLIQILVPEEQRLNFDSKRTNAVRASSALFLSSGQTAGFPFILPKTALPLVTSQIKSGQFSLQKLAKKLRAKILHPPRGMSAQLRNINTPAELARTRRLWREQAERGGRGRRSAVRATGTRRSRNATRRIGK
jgi:molybdopterin-guanine dinucleotide biosynthesis protein A